MDFPHPITPDMQTRAGRMMAAGRCKVTVKNLSTEEHVTVLFACFADNRQRQFDSESGRNWVPCQLADATHMFAEVPTPSGSYNDKIGTYYPKSGRWFEADNADPTRVRAAILAAGWLETQDKFPYLQSFSFQEAMECGVCGAELTDPISQARGIGPTCYGKLTGSQHQVKWTGEGIPVEPVVEQKINFRKDPTASPATTEWAVERDTAGSARPYYHSNETREEEERVEDLGLPTAAENAAYGLLKGMSEEQLRTCREWTSMRIEEVVKMRKALVREAREAYDTTLQQEASVESRDQSFLAR